MEIGKGGYVKSIVLGTVYSLEITQWAIYIKEASDPGPAIYKISTYGSKHVNSKWKFLVTADEIIKGCSFPFEINNLQSIHTERHFALNNFRIELNGTTPAIRYLPK